MYVDATGLSTVVVDVMRETGMVADLVPVYFTCGDRRTAQGSQVTLDKAWLLSRLQSGVARSKWAPMTTW